MGAMEYSANVCMSKRAFERRPKGKEMAKYTTLKDVAQKAGTTIGTVSYVLNGNGERYISEETRRKVMEAAEELHYIRDKGASSLKGGHRRLIGILIPQFENQFFTRIVMAAEAVFVKHGYDMIITNTLDDPEREKSIIRRMLEQRVDGIIVTPTAKGAENTELARSVGMKMVVVDRPLEGVNDYYWVTTNNYGCGFKGIEYLMSMGHGKIGYIGWASGIPDLEAREKAALDAAGDKAKVYVENGEFSAAEGGRLTRKILEEHPDITALFYGFNIQAQGGVNELRRMGRTIGRDISVMLIGTPMWTYTGLNDFSRLDMGDMALGNTAAQVLLDQIQGKPMQPKQYIHDCSVIEGDSVLKIN